MAKTKLYTIYVVLYGGMCIKMMPQAATCMPSSNLWCNKGERSGQVGVHHIFLPREAHYSSQVSRFYVASV